MRLSLRFLALVLLFLLTPIAPAQTTTPAASAPTQPAASPTHQQVRRWFVALADPDPAARDESRDRLMGLTRRDLPVLRAVVQECHPLEPNLVHDLRQIVTHVYLSEDRYQKSPRGFLGITMPQPSETVPDMQVVVESRMPGFCAFRSLRDGDVVVDIEERPLARPVIRAQFCAAVLNLNAGQLIHLKVLRQGRLIRVPIRLDARPADTLDHEDPIAVLLNRRADEANTYWRETFAPLLGETPAPDNPR
jgi:hypothetical protein